jgi:DHA2 family multidrug resistance protein
MQLTADPALALQMAQAEFERIATVQSLTLAFGDSFRLMAWLFIIAILVVPFCRPPSIEAANAAVESHADA